MDLRHPPIFDGTQFYIQGLGPWLKGEPTTPPFPLDMTTNNITPLTQILPAAEKSFASLLSASGITSPTDLAKNQPEKLLRWMEEVNSEQRLVRKLPTLDTVREWIRQAQSWGTAA